MGHQWPFTAWRKVKFKSSRRKKRGKERKPIPNPQPPPRLINKKPFYGVPNSNYYNWGKGIFPHEQPYPKVEDPW